MEAFWYKTLIKVAYKTYKIAGTDRVLKKNGNGDLPLPSDSDRKETLLIVSDEHFPINKKGSQFFLGGELFDTKQHEIITAQNQNPDICPMLPLYLNGFQL